MSADLTGIPTSGILELHIGGDRPALFRFEAPGIEGYIIGRSDLTSSNYIPDVDLSACNGMDQGVSRRHAALVHYQGFVHLVDLNSSNGTFVNGERLRPDSPYRLKPDDKIRFGTLPAALIAI
ncbi:MAG: FHA domain-containing protein [Anaerolineae bacterium]|nr:FHA domain-containing protein [Anaerolineae bacterium]